MDFFIKKELLRAQRSRILNCNKKRFLRELIADRCKMRKILIADRCNCGVFVYFVYVNNIFIQAAR